MLEDIIKDKMEERKGKKYMIIGDIHCPFQDTKAMNIFYKFANMYKPDELIINGDLIDFYNISRFDKNPSRKEDLKHEIQVTHKVLDNIRKVLPKAKIVYLEGNHEYRLQNLVWRNPELNGLDALSIENLLNLNDYKIKFIGCDGDYWKNTSGHYKVNDLFVMHGDNRLNGASTSKYSGYSAKNTMMGIQNSVAINHVHRLAMVYHTTPYGNLIGLECGCLCQPTGTANWQQGFVTFESYKGKNYNYQLHHIKDELIYKGKVLK